ncbi:uncharacterized protein LOC131886297 [Tigriopus californicus]|nr:uncharacterized protein LOC131886297 [Tigriopus californicus]
MAQAGIRNASPSQPWLRYGWTGFLVIWLILGWGSAHAVPDGIAMAVAPLTDLPTDPWEGSAWSDYDTDTEDDETPVSWDPLDRVPESTHRSIGRHDPESQGSWVVPTRVIPDLQSPVQLHPSQGPGPPAAEAPYPAGATSDQVVPPDDIGFEHETGSGQLPFDLDAPHLSLQPTSDMYHPSGRQDVSGAMAATPDLPGTLRPVPPQLQMRLKKLPAIAGRITRWTIPEGTFFDPVQGGTRNLSLFLQFQNGSRIPPRFWLHFHVPTHEVTLMPVDENMIGRWSFVLIARNLAGLEARDILQVVVRQYPGSRVVNHMFMATFSQAQSNPTDPNYKWKMLALMVDIFKDRNLRQMLIRSITEFPLTFGWTNTTYLSSACPRPDIQDQYSFLQSQFRRPDSEVTSALNRFGVRVEHLDMTFYGPCLVEKAIPAKANHSTNMGSYYMNSINNQDNEVPVIRNPIDRINVTAGELLRFQVPKDTCYDPDEGDSRTLTLQLLSVTRKELAKHSWLQFHQANQEFIGVPLEEEVGREEYQLVCSDSNGLSAIDGVEVLVSNRPFTEKINIEFAFQFSNPIQQLRVVLFNKLSQLTFPGNVVLRAVDKFSVVWFDKEFNRDECNLDLIRNASSRYLDDKGLPKDHLKRLFKPLELSHIKILSHRSCNWTLNAVPPTDVTTKAGENLYSFHGIIIASDYLLTFFVPVLIIFFMVVIALALAIALHRRRQAGKLNLFFAEAMPPRLPVILKNDLLERDAHSLNTGLFPGGSHQLDADGDYLHHPNQEMSEESQFMVSPYDAKFVTKSRPAPAYLS